MVVLEEQLQWGYLQKVETKLLVTKCELDYWERMEEIRVSQVAKKRWLADGDENSKFFHAVINQKWNSSIIESMVLEDGTVLASPEEIHEGAVRYFQNFLNEQSARVLPDLSNLISKEISEEDNEWLCKEPTEREVKTTLDSIPKDSSLGPDGFVTSLLLAS